MFVRFLRAYGGRRQSYLETLAFEVESQDKQVCCLKLEKGLEYKTLFDEDGNFEREIAVKKSFANGKDNNLLTNLALLVNKKAVKRGFDGDVYSQYRADGTLYLTRNPRGQYKEFWAKPDYLGIAIPVKAFNKAYKEQFYAEGGIADCIKYAKKNGLSVFVLKKDRSLEKYEENGVSLCFD